MIRHRRISTCSLYISFIHSFTQFVTQFRSQCSDLTYFTGLFDVALRLMFGKYSFECTGVILVFISEYRCDPNDTQFPRFCYANNTQIDGELFLDDWDLNFTPLYADIVALFVMITVCRVSAYFVLRFLRRPKT